MSLAQHYPISLVCEVLDYPRSSFYYMEAPADAEEKALREALLRLAEQWPTYGYRRMTAQLGREGVLANSKRVRRLMGELGLAAKAAKRKVRTTNSEHGCARYPNLVLGLEGSRPDEVWVCDFTYVRLRREFVYLAVIMDVYTRGIRGWHLGRSMDAELVLVALRRALLVGTPEIHHSDQGVQYASSSYVELLKDQGIRISMAEVGAAWQNGFAERLIRTIKEEEVDLSEYEDYQDAYQQISKFLESVYMHKRIHSSLGYLTPAEFEQQWRKQQAEDRDTNSQT
jgi:transposase InsO family protein